jgi:hypothetical protein
LDEFKKQDMTLRLPTLFIVFFVWLSVSVAAQNNPTVVIEPYTINNLPGLQAYAYGKYEGKWIIIGGRTDGLHKRQPFAAFDAAGNNTTIYVVDPNTQQVWNAALTALPQSLQEQLQSTNMQYIQVDTVLYIVGGYGYSATANDHITYPYLTAANLPGLISAIINGQSIAGNFRQTSHQFLAVTGGHLGRLNNTYYLAVGNRFDGRYNPMGNATYTQTYTNAIRKFTINDNGTSLSISNLDSMTDALQLHRRDYNMVPQVFNGNTLGYTIFSEVFQTTADLPFLNSVDFTANNYTPNNNFSQYLNHYHCPNFGVYDSTENKMHSFFFGGISQYYVDGTGLQVQDNNVPFVNTIARVTRDNNSNMTETKMETEMPALLGSAAELILSDDLPIYNNEVVRLNDLPSDTTFIGYIYGGIASTAPNVFFSNATNPSSASNTVFRVYLVQDNTSTGISIPKTESLKLEVYPNPVRRGNLAFTITGKTENNATANLQNISGQIIEKALLTDLKRVGKQYYFNSNLSPGSYILSITSGQFLISERFISH